MKINQQQSINFNGRIGNFKTQKFAKEVIKRDKPVVVAAMYHTPEDFFDLKDKLKTLNPDYKFMIRRSEPIIPMADLVLIAY